MAHGGPSTETWRRGWQIWLVAVAIAVTLCLGAWGLWRYESAHHHGEVDVLSVIYHTFQLLILHAPHLEHDVPWQLHAGRTLGAALFFAAGIAAFLRFFRKEMQMLRLRLPWRRNHVVICGLGDLGSRLALDGQKRGKFIVAIENRVAAPAIDEARAQGVVVLEGDACDADLLRQARVERAEFVVAACTGDHTNAAIAASVGSLVQRTGRKLPALVCRLLIKDDRMRELLASDVVFPATGEAFRVNFGDLAHFDTAARQALLRYPLDFEPIGEKDQTAVLLVVVGFGSMGRSLALQAARMAHFANEPSTGILPRLMVVDRSDTGWKDFRLRYRKLDKVCVAQFKLGDPSDPGIGDELAMLSAAGGPKTLVTYAICLSNHDSLRLGLELARKTRGRCTQILVYQSSRSGFAMLLPGQNGGARPGVHPFGMVEDVFTWDVLLRESEDLLARGIHEDFCRNRKEHGEEETPWERLSENMKDSNRQAADHIPAKLRAVGYDDTLLRGEGQRVEQFTDEQRELMAKMEHHRWCAERWLDNWEHALVTNREEKKNRCLVAWDQLLPEDQRKDPEQVRAIPALLYKLGRGIYPRSR